MDDDWCLTSHFAFTKFVNEWLNRVSTAQVMVEEDSIPLFVNIVIGRCVSEHPIRGEQEFTESSGPLVIDDEHLR